MNLIKDNDKCIFVDKILSIRLSFSRINKDQICIQVEFPGSSMEILFTPYPGDKIVEKVFYRLAKEISLLNGDSNVIDIDKILNEEIETRKKLEEIERLKK